MKKSKDPIIKVTKVIEHKDGSASYDFTYGYDFINMVKKHLKLDREPTKKQIKKFLLDAIKDTVKYNEENGI